MATILLSTIQTCSPNSGTIKQGNLTRAAWHSNRNNIFDTKQKYGQRMCMSGTKISLNAPYDAHKYHKQNVFAIPHGSVDQTQLSLGADYKSEELQKGFSYLFRTEIGGMVKVLVGLDSLKYVVHIEVSSLPKPLCKHNLMLSWGMFRSDSSRLYLPGSQASSSGINQDASELGQGSTKTPFTRNSLGEHSIVLEFDYAQAPFYLSFSLHSSFDAVATDSGIRTNRKKNFCVPVGIGPGLPMPLGISILDDGLVNFSLFSRNAESVILCLYNNEASRPALEIELDPYVNRTGDIWHASMGNTENYISYGYRCKGARNWDTGNRFDMHHVLLDPYAKLIGNFLPDRGESASLARCLGYLEQEPVFDWSGDIHPQLPMEKLVVYRLNVGQFTKDKSSGLPENISGTFAGVTEKLQHFLNLGVNAVLLEPIFSFDEEKGPYFPYHFFSPMSLYGHKRDGASAIISMKEMVKMLHANGIEVLMEVVFTHTSEGGDAACQSISLRGIDNSSYYIVDDTVGSETNNALKCSNTIVHQMILDSLRHWLTEYHVDGFCFIDSSFLLQGSNGDYVSRPPLIEAIAFDPLLSKTKIIADYWSPLYMSYIDTRFPHWKRWAEMNCRFCRDVRNFLRGEGLLSNLATRLCGSGDLFADSRGPSFSFNYITKNFGLPLVDLVSFSSDELASELSWNSGAEGPTNNNSVLEIRLKQIRNFLFILFISLGVPVLNMGDECGQSTGGSPSYGDRQPVDWNGLRTVFGMQVTQFIAFLSSLRTRRSDLFQKQDFLKIENIDWHGSDQSPPNWGNPSCKFLSMTLKAEKNDKMPASDKGDLFVCFNASDLPQSAILPQLSKGDVWLCLVDTSLPFPGFFSRDSDCSVHNVEALSVYELKPHSCALFEAKNSNC